MIRILLLVFLLTPTLAGAQEVLEIKPVVIGDKIIHRDIVAIAIDDPKLLHVSLAGMMGAMFADIATTEYCLGTKTCREANPFMRGPTKNAALAGLVKGSFAIGISEIFWYTHTRKPKTTLVASILVGSFTGYVAYHNSRIK